MSETAELERAPEKPPAEQHRPSLRVHEMIRVFPAIRDDARTDIKESIRRSGILIPVVVWNDAKGTKWLIDGRNRREIAMELNKEGVTINGRPVDIPEWEFKGTEREALNYIVAMNRQRRHLTSSMSAAIAIMAGELDLKYENRERVKQGLEPLKRAPKGDRADEIAKKAHTNRTYIFDCMTLQDEADDLLELVATGEINISQAKDALARRRNPEAPAEGDGAEAGQGGGEPPGDDAKEVKDGLGNVVSDPALAKVFVCRDAFRALARAFKAAKLQVEALAEGPGGAWLYPQEMAQQLQNLTKTCQDAMPHAACAYCGGTGKKPEAQRKKCEHCKGSKYLDRVQWKAVPDDVKGAASGAVAELPEPPE